MIPENIILHCSATKDGTTYSWSAIKKYHTQTLGWDDIGYHYGIENYLSEIIIMLGRKPFDTGAHCRGMNSTSIGVCVVGEYDIVPPDDARLKITTDFLTKLCFIFHIKSSNIFGHYEKNSNKTCPGLMWNMDKVREDVEKKLTKYAPELSPYLMAKIIDNQVSWR